MICLNVKEYCADCPEFEANVERLYIRSVKNDRTIKTVITCEHAQRCESIHKYLVQMENPKDNSVAHLEKD